GSTAGLSIAWLSASVSLSKKTEGKFEVGSPRNEWVAACSVGSKKMQRTTARDHYGTEVASRSVRRYKQPHLLQHRIFSQLQGRRSGVFVVAASHIDCEFRTSKFVFPNCLTRQNASNERAFVFQSLWPALRRSGRTATADASAPGTLSV